MWVLVNMINSVSIKQGTSAFDTMHNISSLQKELGKVGTILPGYPSYKRSFSHEFYDKIIAKWRYYIF